jgi:uncharacterized membrane protein YkoI
VLAGWTLCTIAAAGMMMEPAPAQVRGSQPPRELSRELTREQALQLVQQRYAARVVRTEMAEQSGRRVFVFRLLSAGGKVWSVRIDAQSGAEVPAR